MKKLNKKTILIIAVVLVVVIVAYIVFSMGKSNNNPQEETSPSIELSPSPDPSPSPEPSEYIPALDKTTFLDENFNPTIIEKVERKFIKTINPNISSLTFTAKGLYGLESSTNRSQVTIYEIVISSNNGMFEQKISPLKTWSNTNGRVEIPEGDIIFNDWNQDGFIDFSLHLADGGTMGNHPQRFWLWNSSKGKYVENEQLSEISDFAGLYLTEHGQAASLTKTGASGHERVYYQYKDGKFLSVEVHLVTNTIDENGVHHTVEEISKILNGELQLVSRIVDGVDQMAPSPQPEASGQ